MSKRKFTIPESLWAEKAVEYYSQGYSLVDTHKFLNENFGKVSNRSLYAVLSKHNCIRSRGETIKLKIKKGIISYDRVCEICDSDFVARTPTSVMCDNCTGDNNSGYNKKKQQTYSRYRRFKSYGLKEEQFNEMLKEQNNSCGICKKQLKQPCIDHCHTTNEVRGLLCHRCNLLIGQVELKLDKKTWFDNAKKWTNRKGNK